MGGGRRGKRLSRGSDFQLAFLEKSSWDERENMDTIDMRRDCMITRSEHTRTEHIEMWMGSLEFLAEADTA